MSSNANNNANNINDPLPTGGIVAPPTNNGRQGILPEACPAPCVCPPAQCYRWCIKRLGECLFQASNDTTTLMADSELSLSKLVEASSIRQYTTSTEPCNCDTSSGCNNKEYSAFGCISREWVIQVEYRPDCNQYFGGCNPKKVCNDY